MVRSLLTSLGLLLACSASPAATGPEKHAFRVSLSVSEVTEVLLKAGFSFKDGKTTIRTIEAMQRAFVRHGSTEVWARISTRRYKPIQTVDRTLKRAVQRAKLAKKLGLKFNPEFGLFGSYGDIRGQMAPDFTEYPEIELPDNWQRLSIDQMAVAIQAYMTIAAKTILDTGVEVNVWDIGNEINFGIAGVTVPPLEGFPKEHRYVYAAPDKVDPELGKMRPMKLFRMSSAEQIAWCRAHVWPHTARILKAAAQGIRAVDPKARVSTHLAFPSPGQWKSVTAFYETMEQEKFICDEIGISLYPSNGPGVLTDFRELVAELIRKFKKPVFISEYAYNAGVPKTGPFKNWNHAPPQYPLTEDGQADLLRDLTRWGIANGLSGIRPYAPDGILDLWEPMALFVRDRAGAKTARARKALSAMREALADPLGSTLKK